MIGPQLYAASFVIEIIEAWGMPALVAALLGTGGMGALVPLIIAWRKAPIERRDADIAAAETSQGMSLALAQELRGEIDRLRTEMSELRTELRTETGRRETLADEVREYKGTIYRLRVALSRAAEFWDHVTLNWSTLRQNPEPPLFPIMDLEDRA